MLTDGTTERRWADWLPGRATGMLELSVTERIVSIEPSAALKPFVSSLWHFEGTFLHSKERILPDGNMQLLINLDEDELRSYRGEGYDVVQRIPGAGLCGAHCTHFAIDTREQRAIVGVNFTPGGAYPFFRDPAEALANEHVELAQLWGRDGQVLRERLLEVPSPRGRLQLLQRILIEQLVRPLTREPAIDLAVSCLQTGARIAAVSDQLGLSARRFARLFRRHVGLKPKRFARVQRFRWLIDSLELASSPDWAHVGLATGYFDQAHLIHDFREFAGLSPTQYRPRSPEDRSHVILPNDC